MRTPSIHLEGRVPRRAVVLEGGGAQGAFQAGVLQYLEGRPELRPSIVCGSSVGALNAAAFAFDMVPELVAVWSQLTRAQVYARRGAFQHLRALLFERRLASLYDTAPLRRLLERFFGERSLMDSPTCLKITAFNLQTGEPEDFDDETPVTVVDALMASSAIQGLFPSPLIRGSQYLDGANGANLPLRAALSAGATEVLLLRASHRRQLTPWIYRDIVSLQKRAHLSLMARLTSSDLARARELSLALRRHELRLARLREAIELGVSASDERSRLLEQLDSLPPLMPNRQPLRMRVISPPPGAPMPELLAFEPAVSTRLLKLGFDAARRRLEKPGRPSRKGESDHV